MVNSARDDDTSSRTLTEAESPKRVPHWRIVASHSLLTTEVLNYGYAGSGTEKDPYLVEFIPDDPRNPMLFPMWKKWTLTILVAVATLAVAFVSSAYTGGISQIIEQFGASQEVVTLGVSLFVLGFAIGPLLWAPLSELYGRQILFFGTYGVLTAFNAGAAGSQNIQTLIILRFFAGAFGSSPLTNAGGVIADMFPASQRGLAMSVFAAAPFMGPTLGPIVGGFLGESKGWRWVEGLMAIFTGALWIIGSLTIPETYPPVLLRKRATALSKATGKVYRTRMDVDSGKTPSVGAAFKTALSRPWLLLFREPIVLLLSIYMSIIYGTLYMMFAAFPIVFQQQRGWSEGIGGLAFLGVAVGMLAAVIYTIPDNTRYQRAAEQARKNGAASTPPETRLPPSMLGAVFIPLGLFWFAWTNYPSIHWIVCIIATAPFGFGMVLVFLSIMNYLIDSYTIYAASVLAANSVLRSLFGAAFPLFTTYMYNSLGIHWASSIPAFLALACVPFPFLFYKYGPAIRKRCKFAAEAERIMLEMSQRQQPGDRGNPDSREEGEIDAEKPKEEV
ncbi:MAG: MFS siderochrome iron transporter 1 [Pleopsidium flavum]|nr:MAG: MFS siderochrome iron transporter 1 [Pleopsidium flavum]